MKKYLILSFIVCIVCLTPIKSDAQTVRQIQTVQNGSTGSYDSIYNKDLSQIEGYLYGRTYSSQSPSVRLNRIEKTLFSKSHPNLQLAQRMNMVLENYRDDYYNRNHLPQYYANSSIRNRIRNNLYGQPTGFTPPIFDNAFNQTGIKSFNSSNRGFGYNNFVPANMGVGIHILD